MELNDEDLELLELLLQIHHQWRPAKAADAWVSSACYFLRKLRASQPVAPPGILPRVTG